MSRRLPVVALGEDPRLGGVLLGPQRGTSIWSSSLARTSLGSASLGPSRVLQFVASGLRVGKILS